MSDTLDLRRALVANGYTPLPNRGKMCLLTGWPTVAVDEAALLHWERRSRRWPDTGLRIGGGLAVLDLDVNHEVADAIADALEQAAPELAEALLRFGKGAKRAWFFRTDETFGRFHSRRWLTPDADLDSDGAHAVEAFGGASARQFGAFGAHTRKPDGSVEIAYEWADGLSPATVPLANLPEIASERLLGLIDIAEAVLVAGGFRAVPRTVSGAQEAIRQFDLTEDMVFDCNDDVTRSLEELKLIAGEPGLRCSAAWLEPGASNRERCIVARTRGGELAIWESASGVTHLPVDARGAERGAMREERAARISRTAEQIERLKAQRRATPSTEDTAEQVAAKLLMSHAWCPTRQLPVVPIWATETGAGMSLTNFRITMLPYAEEEIGPRDGIKKINPVDIWASSPQRELVAGLQLRPDMPRPLFVEDGEKWVNTYDPVVHSSEGGDEGGGIALLEQVLPDPAERRWFTQWFAHKYRHPGVPGPAVVMVARHFGTGRGTLGELFKLLFGQRYVTTIPFDTFVGRTYQAQYTEWQADSLVVLVNESSTSGETGSAYKSKHDAYERLKEIVDPRAQRRLIMAKGVRAYRATVCASYLIFTNNPDALPLPEDDRRFFVGTNGELREPEFWDAINAWMENPANIAAFADWLEDVDLSDFDPYAAPPKTAEKRQMASLSLSDLDRAFDEALDALPGELLVPAQVKAQMQRIRSENGYDFPDRWEAHLRRMVMRQLVAVAPKDTSGDAIRIDGKKHTVYARSTRAASKWRALAGEPEYRREVLRNGHPGDGIGKALSKLQLVPEAPKKGE